METEHSQEFEYSTDPMERYAQYLADPKLSERDRQALLGLDDLSLVEAGGGFEDKSEDSVAVKYERAMKNAFSDENNELAQFYISRGFSAESFIDANDTVKLAKDLIDENNSVVRAQIREREQKKMNFFQKLQNLSGLNLIELINLKGEAIFFAENVVDTIARIDFAIASLTNGRTILNGVGYMDYLSAKDAVAVAA